MPAAAVIPAPIAYIKVAAIKKLVVGFLALRESPASLRSVLRFFFSGHPSEVLIFPSVGLVSMLQIFYFEKIRVFKAGINAVNTLAWNNKIGLWFYFVGF